jgi:hypothetical protein
MALFLPFKLENLIFSQLTYPFQIQFQSVLKQQELNDIFITSSLKYQTIGSCCEDPAKNKIPHYV